MRRIVFRHTAGPYPGLRQIVAVCNDTAVMFLRSGVVRPHEGPLPDKLAAHPMWPDNRMARGMRLKSTDTYALYQEISE